MRCAIGIALLLALPVVGAATSSSTMVVRYSTPGIFEAEASTVQGANWAILVFDHHEATFDVALQQPVAIDNISLTRTVHLESPQNNTFASDAREDHTSRQLAAHSLQIRPRTHAAIYVVAREIGLRSAASLGSIDHKTSGELIDDFQRPEDHERHLYRRHQPPGNDAVLTFRKAAAGIPFQFVAEDIISIEWFAVDTRCRGSSWCPPGGGASPVTHATPAGWTVTTDRYYREVLHEPLAITGGGELDYAVLGGAALDFGLDGDLRLPLASGTSCAECVVPNNQTLTASGRVELKGIHWVEPGVVASSLSGNLKEARFDEMPIEPKLLGLGLAGAAAIGSLLFLVKLVLGALFTKLRGEAILEQPRRRLVYETIVARPGIGFSDLARETNLSYGVVRHHLNFLQRNGKVVQRQRGPLSHFFENHGKYDQTWAQVATLRDADLRHLRDWLVANPDRTQQEVVAAMASSGWSRSATRRAIARLVSTRLAVETPHGRFKKYRTA